MGYRRSMSLKKARRNFKRNSGIHPKNSLSNSPMILRGGIRL